jgi:hypothetical protein
MLILLVIGVCAAVGVCVFPDTSTTGIWTYAFTGLIV